MHGGNLLDYPGEDVYAGTIRKNVQCKTLMTVRRSKSSALLKPTRWLILDTLERFWMQQDDCLHGLSAEDEGRDECLEDELNETDEHY